MSHFFKVTLYFFAASLVAASFGLGASFTAFTLGAHITGALVSLAVSAAAVFGGVFITQQSRARFNLMQTGRLVQYGSFWLTGALAFKVAGLVLGSFLVVSNAALASLVATVICFTAATATGRIPWKGRTWLPVRMKNNKK
jgi:hypothetical protein